MVQWCVCERVCENNVHWSGCSEGYDEFSAWSVLLIRPHVSGDELKIQAPDPCTFDRHMYFKIMNVYKVGDDKTRSSFSLSPLS